MKRLLLTLSVFGAFAIGACDDDVMGPETATFDSNRAGAPGLGVMTWNIYVGADLTQLLNVSEVSDVPCAVFGVWNDVLATEFESRAKGIADQIALHRPQVIGLNEVSTFDFVYNSVFADLVFMDVLEAELDARGLSYSVESVATNFQVPGPGFPYPGLPIALTETCPSEPVDFLAYTEYDVILVRDDVNTTAADDGNFAAALPIELPGGLVLPKYSGWASVDIEHKGLPYRVFATHLEPADAAPCYVYEPLRPIHEAQATELMALLDASPYPTILTGDLNSDASGCTTDTYPDLIEAGFLDAWLLGDGEGDGYTANEADDLKNPASQLFHRIDFVLYRDAFAADTGKFQGNVDVQLVGEEPSDRVETSFGYYVWPSDHAGVVANLSIAPGYGHAE